MLRDNRQFKIAIFSLISLIIIGYAVFRLWALISGPSLIVTYPSDGATTSQALIVITGKANRISSLWLNDRQIFTDQEGKFEEPLLLASGYNIMTLRAEDRFGRKVGKKLELVLVK